jgi:membrane protease YdiL (CAAX protease family)
VRNIHLKAILAFPVLLAAFFAVAQSLGATGSLAGHLPSAFLSFALLLFPYWFFGFDGAAPISRFLDRPAKRIAASALLLIPYLIFAVPAHAFRWDLCLSLAALILGFTALLEHGPHWIAALLLLAFAVEAPYFSGAFPGVSGLAKLLFVDLGLFGFLVVRPLGGIGFDLQISLRDWKIGLREFFFFLPAGLAIGFVLQFLHFHPVGLPLARFAAAWIFTLFFIALPEEIFFRGLLLNLLERRWGARKALVVTSLIFGLAHFPKRAIFNWRYVILAAIAGFFYGRAWLDRRRVLTAAITHATVDSVWSIWLR